MVRKTREGQVPIPAKPAGVPSGVKLLRRFDCETGKLWSIAFDASGTMLASGSYRGQTRLWDVQSGKLLDTLPNTPSHSVAFHPRNGILASGTQTDAGHGHHEIILRSVPNTRILRSLSEHNGWITSLAFNPSGSMLVSGSFDGAIKLWDPDSGALLRTLQGDRDTPAGDWHWVWSVAFDPSGSIVASADGDSTIRLWNVDDGALLSELKGHRHRAYSAAFHPGGTLLASGAEDTMVNIWEHRSGKLLRKLEGHTRSVSDVAFSLDGRLLASKSHDKTIRLWNCRTWDTVAILPQPVNPEWGCSGLAFHPALPLLAASGGEDSNSVFLWNLDVEGLLNQSAEGAVAARAVHHATAKIVLVGDHSVGKSGLAYRLIHRAFKEQASTHGQHFWVFPDLGQRRRDGTDCEAILWDLAGQPDYRLVHALFVDNADLALALFDASDLRDPLHGVGFWLKQLQAAQSRCPIILVAAQTDRGTCPLTPDELSDFCRKAGVAGPIATSAFTGEGIEELIDCMRSLIAWEEKTATVTTATFKRIKDHVLGLKEDRMHADVLVTFDELRIRLEQANSDWQFTDAEMLTAVGHLENYGYVKLLQSSSGTQRILVQPELLNNLASSFVLEARRHPKGLGALEERRLLADGYVFPELEQLGKDERELLLDSATLLFLKHHVCFRESDPLRMEPYLVFPELINLKKPLEEDPDSEDGVAYTVTGATENVFASLVVLLGYTHTFNRTAQWQDNARYEMGDGLICAFRQEAERDGELDLVLSFGSNVGPPARTLFQGLFESFLARRNLTVMRYEPVRCTGPECGHLLDRSVVRQRLKEGKPFTFCNECGAKLKLPAMAEPIQLTREVQAEVDLQRQVAEQRTHFEQAVFRLLAFAAEQQVAAPETFISYAWGVPEEERWVEKRLATDLQKAGINVVLDRWHNMQIGANLPRFVDRIEAADRIVVIGTPGYRRKYENKESDTGSVVAAEVDVIQVRLIGTEAQKQSVLPLLLAGDKKNSLPPLLHGRIHADFREESTYFPAALDLILSLYELPASHPLVADLRETLRPRQSK